MSTCVVFVCNGKYLNKFKNTLQSLRKNGQYNGEVLLIIGNDLKEKENEIKELKDLNKFLTIKLKNHFSRP